MNYSKIKHYDIANGEGIRISLFVSGCRFHCKDCFNPETWNFDNGKAYTKETEREILNFVSLPNIDGLSLLGGDPLWQDLPDIELLCALADGVRSLNKNVWLWSGFTWEELYDRTVSPIMQKRRELVERCTVFVDGRFETEKRDLRLRWKGSQNQRVIDVRSSLLNNRTVEYVEEN